MRKLPRYILPLTLFSVATLSAHAQKARIAGLEQDQNYMQLLEQTIRRQPAGWLWSHKRWKRHRDRLSSQD